MTAPAPGRTQANSSGSDDSFNRFKDNVRKLRPHTVLPEPVPPVESLLSDLRLEDAVVKSLSPSVEQLGYVFEETVLTDPFTRIAQRPVTILLPNAASTRISPPYYFLGLSPLILSDIAESKLWGFSYISYFFPKGSQLRIVSEGLDTPKQAYYTIADNWRHDGHSAVFIKWSWLQDLLGLSPQIDLASLCQVLELAPYSPIDDEQHPEPIVTSASGAGPLSGLDPEERRRLIGYLATEATSDPDNFFGNFIQNLDPFGAQPKWQRSPEPDARALVEWAERKQTYPNKHSLHGKRVLGVLIRELYAYSGQEVRDSLLTMLNRHTLLPDDDIAELRDS